ncbi:MAG: RtcB family protein [Treponema sp.]|jgi:RNA-splicing ligase RtcB|nr:RtcB family protein [Treponema sp.]
MIEIIGTYNRAKVFTDCIDDYSREQIKRLCSQPFAAEQVIRLMPDVHAGAGCTIGTTMTIGDTVAPNLVGVDIGCGMETVIIGAHTSSARNFDPPRLDELIHAEIPSGRDIRETEHPFAQRIEFGALRYPKAQVERAKKSIGTLGGGNHFIEAGRDQEQNLYIVIHSGSRHLGTEIAGYYQEEAWKQRNNNRKVDIEARIKTLKAAGWEQDIQGEIERIKNQVITDTPQDLAYLKGELFDDYIHDMAIIQGFADLNRKAMMSVILQGLGIPAEAVCGQFSTIHNYIDMEGRILRKGAVSAKAGEKLIIPINMRDGSIICEGLGNPDWNYSAPHGAGRLMSRKKAFETLRLEEYQQAMEGIYSTSVRYETLDESPGAYKSIDAIISHIEPTVGILARIKPVYNYKAAEDQPFGVRKTGRAR